VLNYTQSRDQHIVQAQRLLQAYYPTSYTAEELRRFVPHAQTAYGLAIHWMAEFVVKNNPWVAQLKRVAKNQIAGMIVERLGLTGFEATLASLFVGFLLDVAFAAFVAWEEDREHPGQRMFNGEVSDTFHRWAAEIGY
jgi:hypothetical protein